MRLAASPPRAASTARIAPLVLVVLMAAGLSAGPAGPVAADAEPSISLSAAATLLRYGENTELSGTITPPAADQLVQIVDAVAPETMLAATSTDADGRFVTPLEVPPVANVTVVAVWGEVRSEALLLLVRPSLSARLGDPRLFDIVRVRGSVAPPHPGARVRVTLYRGDAVVATRRPRLADGRMFTAAFRVMRLGRYRARVRFDDEDHAGATRWTRAKSAPMPPSLAPGSAGPYVRRLEWRLRHLHYRAPAPDRSYDARTGDAVLAFRKVQGMARVRTVDAATWRRLVSPARTRPRLASPAFHVEIDQTRQVLYVVNAGRITQIVHTSTGKSSTPTRDGTFRVHRKIAGHSPGRLYYPSYFDGLRAVHGWPDVPSYPASHGCARVPNWTAVWLHRLMPLGTVVHVYH